MQGIRFKTQMVVFVSVSASVWIHNALGCNSRTWVIGSYEPTETILEIQSVYEQIKGPNEEWM